MAAIELHNALFMSDPDGDPTLRTLSPPPRPGAVSQRPPHTRHLSSYSSTTFHSVRDSYPATDVSHTNTIGGSSVQLVRRERSREPMSRLSHLGTRTFHSQESQPAGDGKAARWKKWAKWALEVIIGAWACYNTVRYFLGSSVYHSHDRRIISIALGASTSLSLVLLISSTLLAWVVIHRRTRREVGTFFSYAASLLLFAPAVVNFVLVFVWRHAADPYVSLRGRCHWDVDVVWTGTGAQCRPPSAPPWGAWLAASLVRLIATVAVLTIYHIAAHYLPRPTHHTRKQSDAPEVPSLHIPLPGTPDSAARAKMTTPMTSVSSASVANRRSPRSNPSSEEHTSSISPDLEARVLRASSPLTSPPLEPVIEPEHEEAPIFASEPNDSAMLSSDQTVLSNTADLDPAAQLAAERLRRRAADMELIQFAAQFRSIVHQMQMEMAEGMDLGASTPSEGEDYTPRSESDGEDYGFPPTSGPSSPDGRIVLGRYVRRMSTIESIGSREGDGATIGSGYRPPSTAYSASRPPTRLTMRTTSETSAPPSRSNSLTLGRAVGDSRPHTSSPLTTTAGDPSAAEIVRSGRASPGPRISASEVQEYRNGRASPGPRSALVSADPSVTGRASPALRLAALASSAPPSPADSAIAWVLSRPESMGAAGAMSSSAAPVGGIISMPQLAHPLASGRSRSPSWARSSGLGPSDGFLGLNEDLNGGHA